MKPLETRRNHVETFSGFEERRPPVETFEGRDHVRDMEEIPGPKERVQQGSKENPSKNSVLRTEYQKKLHEELIGMFKGERADTPTKT